MPRYLAAGLHFGLIPAGFNAPVEFLTGFILDGFACQAQAGAGRDRKILNQM